MLHSSQVFQTRPSSKTSEVDMLGTTMRLPATDVNTFSRKQDQGLASLDGSSDDDENDRGEDDGTLATLGSRGGG